MFANLSIILQTPYDQIFVLTGLVHTVREKYVYRYYDQCNYSATNLSFLVAQTSNNIWQKIKSALFPRLYNKQAEISVKTKGGLVILFLLRKAHPSLKFKQIRFSIGI